MRVGYDVIAPQTRQPWGAHCLDHQCRNLSRCTVLEQMGVRKSQKFFFRQKRPVYYVTLPKLGPSLFWDVTGRTSVVFDRRFGIIYWWHKGSICPRPSERWLMGCSETSVTIHQLRREIPQRSQGLNYTAGKARNLLYLSWNLWWDKMLYLASKQFSSSFMFCTPRQIFCEWSNQDLDRKGMQHVWRRGV